MARLATARTSAVTDVRTQQHSGFQLAVADLAVVEAAIVDCKKQPQDAQMSVQLQLEVVHARMKMLKAVCHGSQDLRAACSASELQLLPVTVESMIAYKKVDPSGIHACENLDAVKAVHDQMVSELATLQVQRKSWLQRRTISRRVS